MSNRHPPIHDDELHSDSCLDAYELLCLRSSFPHQLLSRRAVEAAAGDQSSVHPDAYRQYWASVDKGGIGSISR